MLTGLEGWKGLEQGMVPTDSSSTGSRKLRGSDDEGNPDDQRDLSRLALEKINRNFPNLLRAGYCTGLVLLTGTKTFHIYVSRPLESHLIA